MTHSGLFSNLLRFTQSHHESLSFTDLFVTGHFCGGSGSFSENFFPFSAVLSAIILQAKGSKTLFPFLKFTGQFKVKEEKDRGRHSPVDKMSFQKSFCASYFSLTYGSLATLPEV